jgi:tetratricopeptide (TPR) repeat protein
MKIGIHKILAKPSAHRLFLLRRALLAGWLAGLLCLETSCVRHYTKVGSESHFLIRGEKKKAGKKEAYEVNPEVRLTNLSSTINKAIDAQKASTLKTVQKVSSADLWENLNPEATRLLRETQVSPSNPDAFFRLASYYHSRLLYDKAFEAYQQAIRLAPTGPEYLVAAARLLRDSGQCPEGIELAEKALRISPGFLEGWNTLGTLHDRAGNYGQAQDCYRRALQLNPAADYLHNNLCFSYLQSRRLSQAVQHGETAVRLSPSFEVAHNNLGMAYALLGEKEKAILHFRQAGDEAQAHNNLGLILLEGRRFEEAMDEFKISARLKPMNKTALQNFNRARGLKFQRDREQKLAALERMKSPGFLEEIQLALGGLGSSPLLGKSPFDPGSFVAGTVAPTRQAASPSLGKDAVAVRKEAGLRFEIVSQTDLLWAARALGERLSRQNLIFSGAHSWNQAMLPYTTVYYRPGLASAAIALAHQVPGDQYVFVARKLESSTDIRIVLGEDVVAFLDKSVPARGTKEVTTARK